MNLLCPKCANPMRQYERNGVIVDQCTECGGLFLDRGELERLAQAEANYYDPQSAQPLPERHPSAEQHGAPRGPQAVSDAGFDSRSARRHHSDRGFDPRYGRRHDSDRGYDPRFGGKHDSDRGFDPRLGGKHDSDRGYDPRFGGKHDSDRGFDPRYGRRHDSDRGYDPRYGRRHDSDRGYDPRYGKPRRKKGFFGEMMEMFD
ncbi:TFIIB-type zinc ribbon-containing protein [Cumulibacter manganitolerans]|uniref:TFIIB-type zinc ribbon-containing protein n=1 Tax=Cumulibacter manganitolerans TaxID=1884992 RepID=UPI001295855B|nr:zf-TFIIB domain-containing protein [Cumulibacter manganitolerans]